MLIRTTIILFQVYVKSFDDDNFKNILITRSINGLKKWLMASTFCVGSEFCVDLRVCRVLDLGVVQHQSICMSHCILILSCIGERASGGDGRHIWRPSYLTIKIIFVTNNFQKYGFSL